MSFAIRPRFEWRLRTRTLSLGSRTLLMGILNVTPDSFSDGGRFLGLGAALEHALEMLDDGADILDLGGESTRPNAIAITLAEEQARVLPVLQSILEARPEAVLSIDTYHAETARLAIDAGAEIVNDVSGHLWDAQMSATCATLGCGAVLMHTRGRPQEWRSLPALTPAEVLPLVLRDLEARTQAALAAGVGRASLALDPGFGFGKAFDENYPLLAGLEALHSLGFPILAGVSRKSFLTRTLAQVGRATYPTPASPTPGSPQPTATQQDSADKAAIAAAATAANTAANTAAILAGAHILRVHDVRPARAAATIADRILLAAGSEMPPL